MKEGIHPAYHDVVVECACGNSFKTRSTASRIRLDICSNCHPFYTGRQKLIDTAGRVERFQKRFAKTDGRTVVRKAATLKAAPALSKKTKKILRNTPRVELPPKRGSHEGRPPKPSKPASR